MLIFVFIFVLFIYFIKSIISKKRMMKVPHHYLSDKTPIYIDNNCNSYANGEKIIKTIYKDSNGNIYRIEKGEKTGRIYWDEKQQKLKLVEKRNINNLNMSHKYGYLAYLKYNCKYGRFVTTEISTEKVIASLYTDGHNYYKFYVDENSILPFTISDEDHGIYITKEEYNKLNIIGGSHLHNCSTTLFKNKN